MHEMQQIKCPNCQDSIVKSNGHEVKMRVLMVKWNDKGCFAVCKSCKSDVEIDFDIMKAIKTKFTYETKKG